MTAFFHSIVQETVRKAFIIRLGSCTSTAWRYCIQPLLPERTQHKLVPCGPKAAGAAERRHETAKAGAKRIYDFPSGELLGSAARGRVGSDSFAGLPLRGDHQHKGDLGIWMVLGYGAWT